MDAAGIQLGKVYEKSNKLLKIRLSDNSIESIYRLPENIAGADLYINDIRIDTNKGYAYLTGFPAVGL